MTIAAFLVHEEVLILILHGGEFMTVVQAIELKVVARAIEYLGRLRRCVIIGFKEIVVMRISASFCILGVLVIVSLTLTQLEVHRKVINLFEFWLHLEFLCI